MNKLSVIAVAIGLVLSGCGGDDSPASPGTTPPTTTTNKFIDAAVEGIYYTTSSGRSGVTDSEGQFTSGLSDTVTFYIGGENGLKVGAASNRDVLTPFEAGGKYARSLNLAILLQSLDNQFGNSSDGVLTIPDSLRAPDSATLAKMKNLSLDDRSSVTDFLTAMGVDSGNISSENEALNHMKEAFGSLSRGGNARNPFLTPDKFIRYIDVTQNSTQYTYVHADKTMDEALFERTRGMTEMTFLVNSENSVTALAGSNDYALSEDFAEQYLTCVSNSNHQWIETGNDSTSGCDTDGNSLVDQLNGSLTPDSAYDLNSFYAYYLRESSRVSTADIDYTSDLWKPFDASTASALNHYTPDHVWNDGSSSNPNWIRNTTSGSYDPVTGIYTEIVKKETLGSDQTNSPSRTTERVAYYYQVASKTAERYVDFTGTWETTQICDDGQQAVMTMTFGNDIALSGYECSGSVGNSIPELIEEHGNSVSYAALGAIDYWWFGQTGRESKATLTELNTVVRFCDQDGYVAGNSCNSSDEFFVKWEYQPAGTNWDEGLLTRRKMDNSGNTIGRVSVMQKVN